MRFSRTLLCCACCVRLATECLSNLVCFLLRRARRLSKEARRKGGRPRGSPVGVGGRAVRTVACFNMYFYQDYFVFTRQQRTSLRAHSDAPPSSPCRRRRRRLAPNDTRRRIVDLHYILLVCGAKPVDELRPQLAARPPVATLALVQRTNAFCLVLPESGRLPHRGACLPSFDSKAATAWLSCSSNKRTSGQAGHLFTLTCSSFLRSCAAFRKMRLNRVPVTCAVPPTILQCE